MRFDDVGFVVIRVFVRKRDMRSANKRCEGSRSGDTCGRVAIEDMDQMVCPEDLLSA